MAAPMKRRKISLVKVKETLNFPIKYPETVIFIVERKIQRVRLDHIKKLARKKGFVVAETLNDTITHIVSELETRDQVLAVLREQLSSEDALSLLLKDAEIVSMGWFSSCMEEGAPVEATHAHRLKMERKVAPLVSHLSDAKTCYQDAKYCCQRVTPLNHHNKKFTDALEVLEKQADFLGGDHNASRALAFRKASTALKALPMPVRRMQDVEDLCDLKGGKHCKRVIQEILEEGFSSEVEDILNDEWFKTMKIFTGVFGCGAATGRKWFDMNLRHLEDVKNSPKVNLTTEQRYGLAFYDDINTPVTRREAEAIRGIVTAEAEKILPGATVTITGGFSRGKDSGHDVDLLISHPEEGREEGLLTLLLNVLQKKQLLEYTDVQRSSYNQAAIRQVRRNQVMDHFERCFSIFRLPKHQTRDGRADRSPEGEHQTGDSRADRSPEGEHHGTEDIKVSDQDVRTGLPVKISGTSTDHESTPHGDVGVRMTSDHERNWVARRVDFIIAPQSQYPYALLGWIGSRMFNRSMRDYANREMNMTLTSHGLFDKTKNALVPARNQREIFEHLKLEYREPHERNC